MEVRYLIEPSRFSLIIEDPRIIDSLFFELSYVDKSVEVEIQRFYFSCVNRERFGRTFPKYDEWKKKKEDELERKRVVYCCVRKSPTELLVPIGFFPRIQKWCEERGFSFKGIDKRNFDLETKKLVGETKPFRPYQTKAFEEAIKHKVAMLRMATGCGKTNIGQEIIRHYGLPSIFLVPSKPILNQTYERFRYAFGRKNVDYFGAGRKKHGYITVATYQSVYSAEAKEFDKYSVAIFDEVAHIAADTFFEVAENRLLNCVYKIGLTADEERADGGTILVEGASGPVVYSYDAAEGIKDGFLAKPTFIVYKVKKTEGYYIDWKTDGNGKRYNNGLIPVTHYMDPNPHLAQKNWVIGNDYLTDFLASLARGYEKENKSVLILVDEKEHGEKFKKRLENCAFISSDTKENDDVIKRFNARELKLLCATSVLGEGADTISVDVLINLMGGKRPKQANGRALRNDPDENGVPRKPTCIIIDVDFPNNLTLRDHFLHRLRVHRECGEVHFFNL